MNINFGTNNYIVRYLQTFLKDNYSKELVVTGIFNEDTHNALINYLNLPNVEQMFDVEKDLLDKFPDLNRLFFITRNNDEFLFTSKVIDKETSDYITLMISKIRSFLESVGWIVEEYKENVNWNYDINGDDSVDDMDSRLLYSYIYNGTQLTPEQLEKLDVNNDGIVDKDDLKLLNDYLINDKLFIRIKSSGRENYFPNKDMIPMINLFPGTFLYNKAFRGGKKTQDFIDDDETKSNKICLIKCDPDMQYTIAHGSKETSKLIIGSYTGKRTNLSATKVKNVKEIDLVSGDPYVYTTTSDATYLVIQCSSTMGHISKPKAITIPIKLGDINFDGKIDELDKKLLADYLFYPEGHPNRPIFTNKQKVAADINNNGKIDQDDMVALNNYLKNNSGGINLGERDYTYYAAPDIQEGDKIARLLIIKGDATKEVIGSKVFNGINNQVTKNKYGINFNAFRENPWIVHEKFIPYLLGIAIHKYSRSEDITYVQDILKELYPETANNYIAGHYSDDMRKLVLKYQMSMFNIKAGDFDADGKITNIDEQILREYLDGERQLSPSLLDIADLNNDKVVDESDYEMLQKYRQGIIDDLNVYTIPFYLGWVDVQTEALMLRDIGSEKSINEVGWR